jgi:hypothetical protein
LKYSEIQKILSDWDTYDIPSVADFTIFSALPKYRTLKKYIDTVKNVSRYIMLEFKMNHNFAIKGRK